MTADKRAIPFNYGRDHVISYPVTASGIRTRVVESLDGTTPLVFLHGVGSRADRFIPAIPGLVAAGYHVYAIDFPGHGFADKVAGIDYRPRGFAEFIGAVLDELQLEEVIVAGTSLGGHVAARLACDRPDLVAGLVLIGTTGIAELPEVNMVAPEGVADGSVSAVRKKFGFLVSDPAMVTDAWVREESMINSSAGARDALLTAAGYLNSEANTDLQGDRLMRERPELPVLIVWGEDDRWTPLPMGRAAHELLKGSVLQVMPGCGHAPYFEDPDTFVGVVSDFYVDALRRTGGVR
ncbi:alpha/beta fold hydrolase [Mycolicibacterium stellerae]|uniref:alpha/beta fold hydrolase n=1 Tax=Mycolicibacterium stellerae TaxID=2358193 RepID=UPI000F0B7D1E|nr:alpha/beta hydrolase [Mycolicibacterium stellerae]